MAAERIHGVLATEPTGRSVRPNARCLIRMLLWARDELEVTLEDQAAASNLDQLIEHLKQRFAVSDDELVMRDPEQIN